MNIGYKIKHLRKKRGLTQLELSRKLNVKHNTVSDYESNKTEPRISALIKLAREFDVTVDELVGMPRLITNNHTTNINPIEIKVNEEYVNDLIDKKLDDYISSYPTLVLWDSNDLKTYTRMSWNTIQDSFFHDPSFPKFKVGNKWFFPAKEAENFINHWALEKTKKGRLHNHGSTTKIR